MNPIKGEVPLALADGSQFTLVLDMEALVQGESAYGKPLGRLLADTMNGFIGAQRALLFGALRAHHPEVRLREISDLFLANQDVILEALTEAVEAGFPASTGGNVGAKPAPPPGKRSGRSGAKQSSTRKRSGEQPQELSS